MELRQRRDGGRDGGGGCRDVAMGAARVGPWYTQAAATHRNEAPRITDKATPASSLLLECSSRTPTRSPRSLPQARGRSPPRQRRASSPSNSTRSRRSTPPAASSAAASSQRRRGAAARGAATLAHTGADRARREEGARRRQIYAQRHQPVRVDRIESLSLDRRGARRAWGGTCIGAAAALAAASPPPPSSPPPPPSLPPVPPPPSSPPPWWKRIGRRSLTWPRRPRPLRPRPLHLAAAAHVVLRRLQALRLHSVRQRRCLRRRRSRPPRQHARRHRGSRHLRARPPRTTWLGFEPLVVVIAAACRDKSKYVAGFARGGARRAAREGRRKRWHEDQLGKASNFSEPGTTLRYFFWSSLTLYSRFLRSPPSRTIPSQTSIPVEGSANAVLPSLDEVTLHQAVSSQISSHPALQDSLHPWSQPR